MSESKEVKGTFRYEQDNKRFHRFKIETDAGVVGTLYVPKDAEGIPGQIILKNAKSA